MAWPSWFPTGSRPTSWKDWSAIYKKIIPREWPRGLYSISSEAWADLKALGESLALARDLLQWLLLSLWPLHDDYGNFHKQWGEAFGIQTTNTPDTDATRLVAAMRQVRQTMTSDAVKGIMCRTWGSDDPSVVSFGSPTAADIVASTPATDAQWTRCSTSMHIYHTDQTTAPDYGLADDLIAKIKPTGDTWTVGKKNTMKWGPHADAGQWSRSTWGG